MKPIVILILAVVLSTALSLVVVTSSKHDSTAAAAPAPSDDIARLARQLDELSAQNVALRKTLEDLKTQRTLEPANETRVPIGEIEAAVERALKDRGANAKPEVANAITDDKTGKTAATKKMDPQAALRDLCAPDLSWEGRQELWKAIREAGITDDVLALFEQNAKDNPNDTKAMLELGKAYLQKLFTVNDGPEKGIWATKADRYFDAALKIDDHNWEARFQKAVSLSFWPAFLGKQGEAVNHFEVLVQQQENVTQHPEFAQTHLYLGNMYQQMGNKEKAIAAWQHGLSLFPDNAQLQQQIANAQAH